MSCGQPVVDLRARRFGCANRIAPLPTLHPGPRSWTAGLNGVNFGVIQLPKRPPPSSRGMLIFCAVVFVALLGVLIFLNRARAQKPNEAVLQSKFDQAVCGRVEEKADAGAISRHPAMRHRTAISK